MLEAMTEELDIGVHGGGSTTFKQEILEHGLEPDECYWVANEPKVRGCDEIDLDEDPPPDLVIEVEVTRHVLPRLKMYAALGVPEVWRYDGQQLRVLHLSDEGEYTARSESRAFPFLPVAEFPRFLAMRGEMDETSLIRSFREWVRTLPRTK
jgi:Uma2 family endonuclease